MKRVLIIAGPTASGKSDLAVKLAKKFNGEIISADSRQVYKGLNIGTGKITKKEMLGVPHHLLDVADPKKQFSASDFAKIGSSAIDMIYRNGKLPIIVGGTGFYIDALTGASTLPEVPPNKMLRKKLEKLSKEKLFEILKEKDPRRAKTIDQHNKVRLIRALEIIEALGKVPAHQPATSTDFVYIGLKPDMGELGKKIYQRLLKRLSGMIKEGKKLHSQGLTYKRMHELGLEYRYIAMFLQGKLDRMEMIEKLNTEIKRYAKRQMTWFKRNKEIGWFKPSEYAELKQYLEIKLQR